MSIVGEMKLDLNRKAPRQGLGVIIRLRYWTYNFKSLSPKHTNDLLSSTGLL